MAGAARGGRGLHGGPCARNRCGAWGCGNCTDYSVLFKILKNQKIYPGTSTRCPKKTPAGTPPQNFFGKVRALRARLGGISWRCGGAGPKTAPSRVLGAHHDHTPRPHRRAAWWPNLARTRGQSTAHRCQPRHPACLISPSYRPQTLGEYLCIDFPTACWLCPARA